ncbi:DNA topoisomerase [Sphingobacterium sp. SRCM116780]|uniref:type IA DNA topoisomerase n=1 Tax=Sphingobacterium sp. SRCM116780 TaxID=2907623 RepID=UPI001F2B2B06|nr:type IA DNA topoisomerase [Sphingobacterium sp. SRCM116780]UIR57856.1 DNA topoisomerase [Sphingobacterium sp. SRCM116780]
MKAIIAEKPSVAHELARIVGATEKKEGYFIGNDFMVTWAFGHLVGLAMPEDYGINGFNRESLPIIPESFRLISRKVRSGKEYVFDQSAKRQLEIIGQVFERSNGIIVATDAGREGEVIFRYIYEYLGCNKPFERLWISSLTENAIINGLSNLKIGSDFDGLYFAGRERSQADWLIGINSTQALTIAIGDGLYSLGRVQTPTLSLICKRYHDHQSFEIKNYFQIQLEHQKEGTVFTTVSTDKWDEQAKAEAAARTIERAGTVSIIDIEQKSSSVQAPLLFDLTGLQKEANKKLGFSAEKTLEIAQSLYEKKFISYPRTGSKYIPEDVWAEIPALIRALGTREASKGAVDQIKWERYNKHIVNDLKVTDHHGILITENIPTMLAAHENTLYDMIANRLLETVSPACHREITTAVFSVLHYEFGLKAIKITSPGWKSINGNFEDEDEDIFDLPHLEKGNEINIRGVKVLAKKTKPPALFTEAELLSAMENVGNAMEDKEERKVLKSIGIGTPATRAAVIETLFDRDYIRREKKAIIPTEKGLLVYQIVGDKIIANANMTAQWEMSFEKIQNAEMSPAEFHLALEELTKKVTEELLQVKVNVPRQEELCCPKCKSKVFLREKIVKCANDECGWMLFRYVCGINLSYNQIEALLNTNRTPLIRKMVGRSGKQFDAYIIMAKDGSTTFDFEKKKKR